MTEKIMDTGNHESRSQGPQPGPDMEGQGAAAAAAASAATGQRRTERPPRGPQTDAEMARSAEGTLPQDVRELFTEGFDIGKLRSAPTAAAAAMLLRHGMSQGDVGRLLIDAGHDEKAVAKAIKDVPTGPSVHDRLSEDDPEAAPFIPVQQELPDLQADVARMRGLAQGTEPLSEEDKAFIESADGIRDSWKERLKAIGKSAGKGFVWTILTAAIAYIFLLKTYAGAAAKKR